MFLTELCFVCHFWGPVCSYLVAPRSVRRRFHSCCLRGQSMEDHAGRFLWSTLGFHQFHLSPLVSIYSQGHPWLQGCLRNVLTWPVPVWRSRENWSTASHTAIWHFLSTFILSFLQSRFFILWALFYFKLGNDGEIYSFYLQAFACAILFVLNYLPVETLVSTAWSLLQRDLLLKFQAEQLSHPLGCTNTHPTFPSS